MAWLINKHCLKSSSKADTTFSIEQSPCFFAMTTEFPLISKWCKRAINTSVSIQWTTTFFCVALFNVCWTIIVSASLSTKVCLNLDILGFSYIFTRPFTFAKSITSEVMVYFIIGCVESMLDLGYFEDIKPMTCVVNAPVVVSSLWSKLSAINWRKYSIDSSSDNVSVNSMVDTLAHFSKSNIAEYDNKSPNAYRAMAMVIFRKFFFSWAVNVLDFLNVASRKYDNFFEMRVERFSRVRSPDKDNILHVYCFFANIVQSLGQWKRILSDLPQRYNYSTPSPVDFQVRFDVPLHGAT